MFLEQAKLKHPVVPEVQNRSKSHTTEVVVPLSTNEGVHLAPHAHFKVYLREIPPFDSKHEHTFETVQPSHAFIRFSTKSTHSLISTDKENHITNTSNIKDIYERKQKFVDSQTKILES